MDHCTDITNHSGTITIAIIDGPSMFTEFNHLNSFTRLTGDQGSLVHKVPVFISFTSFLVSVV